MVLVYKIDGDKVFVNDPAGFARVFIDKKNLYKAWYADKVGYKRGHFRYWANPERVKTVTEDELYFNSVDFFKEVYMKAGIKAFINNLGL